MVAYLSGGLSSGGLSSVVAYVWPTFVKLL